MSSQQQRHGRISHMNAHSEPFHPHSASSSSRGRNNGFQQQDSYHNNYVPSSPSSTNSNGGAPHVYFPRTAHNNVWGNISVPPPSGQQPSYGQQHSGPNSPVTPTTPTQPSYNGGGGHHSVQHHHQYQHQGQNNYHGSGQRSGNSQKYSSSRIHSSYSKMNKRPSAQGGKMGSSFHRGSHSNGPHAKHKRSSRSSPGASSSNNRSSGSSSKSKKKPEVPCLPKMTPFERKLRRVRILMGIGSYKPENPFVQLFSAATSPTSIPQENAAESLYKNLYYTTLEYKKKQEDLENKHSQRGNDPEVQKEKLQLDLAYYHNAFTQVFSVLEGSTEVSLTPETIDFLSTLCEKAENTIMNISSRAGTYSHQDSGVTSSIFEGKWNQRSSPVPVWQSIPALKCILLPVDAADGPQQIEIRPYPRTKKDLELFFQQRGSFRSNNAAYLESSGATDTEDDEDISLHFFVVTRKRPVVAFRSSQGRTPFTKFNRLTEKWIHDIRVKKFFGPVVLFKVHSHDPVTDELEVSDYTMEDFDKQISTNFSLEELLGVKMQIQQEASQVEVPQPESHRTLYRGMETQEPFSSFQLDSASLQRWEPELIKMCQLNREDWLPFFRGLGPDASEATMQNQHVAALYNDHESSSSNDTPQVESNLLFLLRNVISTALSIGAYTSFKDHYVVRTNIPLPQKSKFRQNKDESVVYAVLKAREIHAPISSINSCVFGYHRHHNDEEAESRKQDEASAALQQAASFNDSSRQKFSLICLGTWSQIKAEYLEKSSQAPHFCIDYMPPINLKKKNTTLSVKTVNHVAKNPEWLPSRLYGLTEKELKYLFGSFDTAIEDDFHKDGVQLTPALIDNQVRFLIPIQMSESEPNFIDGAVVLNRTGSSFTGFRLCSPDEALVAVKSISNAALPWVQNLSSHVLTISGNMQNADQLSLLRRKLTSVCEGLRVDVVYIRVDRGAQQVEVMLRHLSGNLRDFVIPPQPVSADTEPQMNGTGAASASAQQYNNSSSNNRVFREHQHDTALTLTDIVPLGAQQAQELDIRNEFNVPKRVYKQVMDKLKKDFSLHFVVEPRIIRELRRGEFERVQLL